MARSVQRSGDRRSDRAGRAAAVAAGSHADEPDRGRGACDLHLFSLRILSGPATLANYAILGFLLGQGRSKTGLALQALINGVNIALSVLFGLVLHGALRALRWRR